ncbi:MAG: aldo/keto reductase [Rhodospirillales bacterium]|nr:MAG: aldo/keto reductase [Rhodospirillales bacterium]
MQQRTLGETGIAVTPLGLGMAALGRPGYINLGHAEDLKAEYDPAVMAAHAAAVLDAAWDAGVRYFDAARSYGRGEAFLGEWLRNRGITPEAVAVGSKWGYIYTADWQVDAEEHEVKEHSLDVFRRQWPESAELLEPHLRLYQVHSATLSSGVLENRPLLEAMAALRSDGVAVGLTTSGTDQAEVVLRALELRVGGQRLFDVVQTTWNILEPSAGSALAAASREGVGVIVKEAMANGRLAGRATGASDAVTAVLRREAERLATTVDALALAAALAQPWADVVLSGAATPQQVRSNAAAVSIALDAQAWEALGALTETPQTYWRTRSALPWT